MTSVGEDTTCRVWSLEDGSCVSNWEGHEGKHTWRVSVNPSGSLIVITIYPFLSFDLKALTYYLKYRLVEEEMVVYESGRLRLFSKADLVCPRIVFKTSVIYVLQMRARSKLLISTETS
jgi:hypothetical protein